MTDAYKYQFPKLLVLASQGEIQQLEDVYILEVSSYPADPENEVLSLINQFYLSAMESCKVKPLVIQSLSHKHLTAINKKIIFQLLPLDSFILEYTYTTISSFSVTIQWFNLTFYGECMRAAYCW